MKKEKTFIYMYSLIITATTFEVVVNEYEVSKMNSNEILLTNGQSVSRFDVVGRYCGNPIDVQENIARQLLSCNKDYINNGKPNYRHGVFSTIKYCETLIAHRVLEHCEELIDFAKKQIDTTKERMNNAIGSYNNDIKSLNSVMKLIKSRLSPTKAK